jgi:hypothetical protein
VPASHGYVSILKLSYQVFVVALSGLKLVNPENQSGLGAIMEIEEMRGKAASTLKASSNWDSALLMNMAFPSSWAKTSVEFPNSTSNVSFTPVYG